MIKLSLSELEKKLEEEIKRTDNLMHQSWELKDKIEGDEMAYEKQLRFVEFVSAYDSKVDCSPLIKRAKELLSE